MPSTKLQDILSQVEQPSRYLGYETNRILKSSEDVRLHIALAFPDMYDIGTSHFGMQILYHVLNRQDGIAAERVFAPADDFAARLTAAGLPLMSLESRRPLSAFDIIGFSLLYELNYTNVLFMLKLAGIPWQASQRNADMPLVIAGGPCTFNPEPVADFFDAMVVGDGETVILEMASAWLSWKADGGRDKDALLHAWAQLTGVYVPSLFTPRDNQQGLQVLEPRIATYPGVTKALVADLNLAPFPQAPVVPLARPVHDRLRLEIARGCTRGCRFCQAGMIYRPVRERDPEKLLELAVQALDHTGYEDLSLLSLSTGDYGCIDYLLQQLMQHPQTRHVAVSLPSLRVGSLTPELMALIRQVRKTGFTLAPEAGSARLRAVINKNITEDDMRTTVENAFEMGWQVIKLYFMVGLPTETSADLEAMVALVRELRRLKNRHSTRKSKTQINVSFTTFIPKSHTPFQWAPQISLAESREKIAWLQGQLRMPGIQVKWQNPEVSLLEGLWARGDRRLAALLMRAVDLGCRFDGWSDHFNFGRWQTALEQSGIAIDDYVTRVRTLDEPLPWDVVNAGVTKDFLKSEYLKALNQESTSDCRDGHCHQCGVCDFKAVQPLVAAPPSALPEVPKVRESSTAIPQEIYQVNYQKRDDARFFGHLEMVNLFLRALRRARVPLLHTHGFHPKPKVSFDNPLPVGMESTHETFYFTTPAAGRRDFQPAELQTRLNALLPPGLSLTACRRVPHIQRATPSATGYRVQGYADWFTTEQLDIFAASENFEVQRTNQKGRTTSLNLKTMVRQLKVSGTDTLEMILDSTDGIVLRPQDVLVHIFNLTPETIRTARILKYVPM